MRRNLGIVVCVTACGFAPAVMADANAPRSIEDCANQYKGDDDATKQTRFACYDGIEAARSGKSGSSIPPPEPATGNQAEKTSCAPDAGSPYHLDALWDSCLGGVSAYKQSYVMATYTGHPDDLPGSPNPANQLAAPEHLQHTEIKFQFSLKVPILDCHRLGGCDDAQHAIWFAYTQQSNWQAFDAADSSPFRESNYEPEVIYSRLLSPATTIELDGFKLRVIDAAFVHQSNGQADPLSRSWNRVYLRFGAEKMLGDKDRLVVSVRPWKRVGDSDPSTNDNPDITRYLGRGDVEVLYWRGNDLLSALARIRSLQLDYSFPLFGPRDLQGHLQYFTGYGESLIDYNQRHSVLGVGVSLPY